MKKITKTTIASIAAIVFSFGCLAQATATTITLSSKGIINSPGADGVEGTADDIVFDSRDLVTLKNNIESAETSVTNGKNALRTEINNNVSDANKLPTTGTPTFDDLVAKISKIREKGREDVVQAPQTYLPAGSQKAAQTYTPSTSNQVINAGQYLTGAQTILGDTDLVAGNIKSGVNLFGVTGTYITPQTGTFTPNSSQVNLTAADMGATNTNRYVNTATCYSAGRTSVWNEIKSKGGNYSNVDTLAKLNDAINADNISSGYVKAINLQSLASGGNGTFTYYVGDVCSSKNINFRNLTTSNFIVGVTGAPSFRVGAYADDGHYGSSVSDADGSASIGTPSLSYNSATATLTVSNLYLSVGGGHDNIRATGGTSYPSASQVVCWLIAN